MENDLYSVGDICILTGVTRKTLFYYDRINLLKPTELKGVQKHKFYDGEKLERLKTILRYREAGLNISEIKRILDNPEEEPLQVFQQAMKRLLEEFSQHQAQIEQLKQLIDEYNNE